MMEPNIKFNEKMLIEMANRVLDEYEYNGETIREWADLIAHPKTNADRIRAMGDEELAEYMHQILENVNGNPEICPSIIFLKQWLKQEAKEK